MTTGLFEANLLPGVTDLWTLVTIAGLACVTVLTRSFFFISERDWKLPHWAERGLQYAPLAALAAVIVPEIAMSQGALIAVFYWRKSTLGCIVGGMAVYLPLHIGLGW
jgi:branched-subunit amino acid transport protein